MGKPTLYVNDYYEKNLTTGEVTTHYYLGDREVAYKNDSGLYYIHQDHLGSTALVTDSNGNVVASSKYLPYGESRPSTGDPGTDKLFTGQRLDQSGLYFYNARYYDPQIGRFVSADTVVPDPSDPQNLNRYSYVLNNPLKYTDPSGHFAFLAALIWVAVGAATGAATHTAVHVVDNAVRDRPDFEGWNWKGFAIDTAIGGALGGLGRIPVVGKAIGAVTRPVRKGVSAVVGTGGRVLEGLTTRVGSALNRLPGGEAGLVRLGTQKLTGQLHHAISKKIYTALEKHPTLKGLYRYRDPRFATRAKDLASHCGYQTCHRNLDDEVVRWIYRYRKTTSEQFETYLRNRYSDPDLLGRFPNGL